MAEKSEAKDIRKLFEQKEKLLEAEPELNQSYSQFLSDWKKYQKSQEGTKKSKVPRSYSAFGASFKKE